MSRWHKLTPLGIKSRQTFGGGKKHPAARMLCCRAGEQPAADDDSKHMSPWKRSVNAKVAWIICIFSPSSLLCMTNILVVYVLLGCGNVCVCLQGIKSIGVNMYHATMGKLSSGWGCHNHIICDTLCVYTLMHCYWSMMRFVILSLLYTANQDKKYWYSRKINSSMIKVHWLSLIAFYPALCLYTLQQSPTMDTYRL